MSTLGFLQYLSPSITLIVATVILGEHFSVVDAATFGCVWAALVLVGLERHITRSFARGHAWSLIHPYGNDCVARGRDDPQGAA